MNGNHLPDSGFSRQRRSAWSAGRPRQSGGFAPPRFVTSTVALVIAAVIVGVAGGAIMELLDRLEAPPKGNLVASDSDRLRASFSNCSGAIRVNCVVDGDTFWFRGIKIRIAGIDAPELFPPRCERERELGEAAKKRLRELLNADRFSLEAVSREKDRYGRVLRNVYRGGYSLGDVLVREGLARRLRGPRQGWCDRA